MTTTNKTLHLAIGRCDYISGTNATSITILSFDTDTGDAKRIGSIETGPNPSWITVDHDAKLIYCTGENSPRGSIRCFPYPKIVTDGYVDDGDEEEERQMTTCCDAYYHVETSGAPCHIALLDDDTLCCTNYAGGDVTILRRRRRRQHHHGPSTTDDLSHYIVEGGRLPSNPAFRNDRQESSHPHHATPLVLSDDDGLRRHVVAVADLGRDVVSLLDYKSGRWVTHIDTGEGTGPRRALLHGDHLYIMNELNNTISVVSPRDSQRGSSSSAFLQKNIPLLENPSTTSLRRHHRGGSEMAISPCGTYLIAATRSTNEFVVFRISSTDGRLRYVDRVGSVGTTPRHVAFVVGDTTTVWFLAACHLVEGSLYGGEGEVQRSDCVVVFEFEEGGVLRFVREIPCPFATCVAVL